MPEIPQGQQLFSDPSEVRPVIFGQSRIHNRGRKTLSRDHDLLHVPRDAHLRTPARADRGNQGQEPAQDAAAQRQDDDRGDGVA